ncbi:signal peptide peptidase SppA [Campylobacter sp. RM16192]|uniref:signal peptide peptidase SppA n=1 Tax=Campylobacter sp. RM16192 TaxID=1660080 RepID=UPI001451F4E8|nr:signal peptide peptidase SppA [Campylobacter sp. RM16192]QCD53189.1 signal peptide peptidase protease IV [Campylobacter sp. RM16192]
MNFLKLLFSPIVAIFKFINEYFKTMIFLLILFFIFIYPDSKSINNPNLVQIDISGMILDSQKTLKEIHEATKHDHIKGVLLFIDSPGGALAPSTEIAMAVKKLRAKKPVIAYAGGAMTSGSYYSGVNSNKILANPGSFIGSIGVIIQAPNISELANKIGISQQVVKAGEFKEVGTFARKWSSIERNELEKLVKKSYDMFVKDVATARNLDVNKSLEWANARVFLASDAKRVGLIDDVSDYYSARKEIENLSGVAMPVWKEKHAYERALDGILKDGVNSVINSVFINWIR